MCGHERTLLELTCISYFLNAVKELSCIDLHNLLIIIQGYILEKRL